MDIAPALETVTRSYPSFEDARNMVVRLMQAGSHRSASRCWATARR